jgi:hypothetical protein
MDAERHVVQFGEVVRTILDVFEERNGYPLGENVVVEATRPEHLSVLTEEFDGRVPEEVTTFFNRVAEIKLPNLWNGYFIGPTSWVAGIHKAAEPGAVRFDGGDREIMVLATNGGGVTYGRPTEGDSGVFVLPPAGIDDGVYLTDSLMARNFREVAGSFEEFLEELASSALAGAPDPFDPYRR